MVLSNAKAVGVSVPADDEATRIRLCPEALSLSRLGGCCRTCQTTEVFIFGSEDFDLFHDRCIGGGESGDGGGELLEHRLFVGGSVSQFVEIVLEFLILNGLSR